MYDSIQLTKGDMIHQIFFHSGLKKTLAEIALKSSASDRIELAEKFANEAAELDLEAWALVFERYPQTRDKSCKYNNVECRLMVYGEVKP